MAAWEGVFVLDRDRAGHWTKTKIGTGNQDANPFKGASEVKVGHLLKNSPFIATIEPWHGFQVVVYFHPSRRRRTNRRGPEQALWTRQVIAEPVQWGHAVWCADLDADGDDELIIGQRDPNKPGAIGAQGTGRLRLRRQTRHGPAHRSTGTPSTTAAWPARMPWRPTWTATAAWTSSPAAGPRIT